MKLYSILLLGALCVGMAQAHDDDRQWFIDKSWVYERGSALSSEYLKEHAPEFSKKIEKDVLSWIVRIEVRYSITEEGYKSNHGTGIILKDGVVLTAKHVMTENVPDGGEIEIILTTVDGQIYTASAEEKGERDWARLRMNIEEGQMLHSPVETAEATSGETVVFFGYPAQLGLDAQSHVKAFRKGNKEKGELADRLLPMLVVASAENLEAMTLKPLAGFPPVGGMSGGPLLNLKGQFVGVQNGVSTTIDNATGGVLYYTVDATPFSAVTIDPCSEN